LQRSFAKPCHRLYHIIEYKGAKINKTLQSWVLNR
jgi:hypothetical protein